MGLHVDWRLVRAVSEHVYNVGEDYRVVAVTEAGEMRLERTPPNISADEAKCFAESKRMKEELAKARDEIHGLRLRLADHEKFVDIMKAWVDR